MLQSELGHARVSGGEDLAVVITVYIIECTKIHTWASEMDSE